MSPPRFVLTRIRPSAPGCRGSQENLNWICCLLAVYTIYKKKHLCEKHRYNWKCRRWVLTVITNIV